MADAGTWAGALLGGAVLGAVFFGGLWWTVQRGMVSVAPARWLIASLVVRTAIVLAGFHAVGGGQPVRLGVCMLGFLLARALILRATRPAVAAMGPPCA